MPQPDAPPLRLALGGPGGMGDRATGLDRSAARRLWFHKIGGRRAVAGSRLGTLGGADGKIRSSFLRSTSLSNVAGSDFRRRCRLHLGIRRHGCCRSWRRCRADWSLTGTNAGTRERTGGAGWRANLEGKVHRHPQGRLTPNDVRAFRHFAEPLPGTGDEAHMHATRRLTDQLEITPRKAEAGHEQHHAAREAEQARGSRGTLRPDHRQNTCYDIATAHRPAARQRCRAAANRPSGEARPRHTPAAAWRPAPA